MSRQLIGVGVGPGDPELITVKAVRVLREADLVLVPVMAADEQGRAEATVRVHLGEQGEQGDQGGQGRQLIRRVVFALNEREDQERRAATWEAAAAEVVAAFAAGAQTIAFATIGDPNVYSTFSYLSQTVRAQLPHLVVSTVPGITAMQALAATSSTVLCEGTESLMLLPITAGITAFEAALATADTVVAYKGGRRLPELRAVIERHGRLTTSVFGSALGLEGEQVSGLAEVDGPAAYLSTIIVPPAHRTRGGRL